MLSQAVMVHTFKPSTREAERGKSLNLRLVWSIGRVSGQVLKATEKPTIELPTPTKKKKNNL